MNLNGGLLSAILTTLPCHKYDLVGQIVSSLVSSESTEF